jgi:hypothetical protein
MIVGMFQSAEISLTHFVVMDCEEDSDRQRLEDVPPVLRLRTASEEIGKIFR